MRHVVRAIALAMALLVAAAFMEVAVRRLDGYRLSSLQLVPVRAPIGQTLKPGELVRRYAATLPVAEGVRREWFDVVPAELPRPPLPPELAVVTEQSRSSGVGSDLFKQWNTRYLKEKVCSGDPLFRRFPGFAFSYEPDEPTLHPPYRFIPSLASPYGLVTNRFGFRGHDITPDKPAGVIRIAFVGASATLGSHVHFFSYPEFIEPWLNLWAQSAAPGVRFETINAGREGISSTDIAAIVRQEVVSLEPDVIVFYEGGNQFTPQTMIQEENGPRAPPDTSTRAVPGTPYFALLQRLTTLSRRLRLGFGAEPAKPRYRLNWPASVSEADPNPDSSELPLDLPRIVYNLDDIRQSAAKLGATVAVSSFIWRVDSEMKLDPVNSAAYYEMLNVKLWPTTYADIRRMADFQNRVFRNYAAKRQVPFLDVASAFPKDVNLFEDPVHPTLDGDRLRAWVVFQQLLPILRAGIGAGRWPQADRMPFGAVSPLASLQRTETTCANLSGDTPIAGAVSVADLTASDESSTVTGSGPKHLVTTKGRNGYSAIAPIAAVARISGPGAAHIRLRVQSGRVAVGVLKPDQSAFVIYRTVETSTDFTELYLPVPSLSDAGFVLISNAVPADGQRSIVDVDQIRVLKHQERRPGE